MASTNLSIKYRPVKIGFLVRDGSVEDLVKASGINTLLWGGIYNPIIPVSADKEFAEQLMDLFSVDVLFPVSQTKEIDSLIKEYPFLKAPMHYNQNIFYEDYISKKNNIGYLDSLNIVNYYWDKEVKYRSKGYQSRCTSLIWEENEELKHFFSILFGYFPTDYNLRDNFENAFLKGMRSKVVYISINGPFNKELVSDISPIKLTGSELIGYGGTWGGNGIYVGDENNFDDLLYFWNLRASGLSVDFLPKNKIERFREFIKESIQKLDDIPNKNPNIEDWITVYYAGSHDEVKEIIKEFQGKKRFVFNHCDKIIWNGLNIKPTYFCFGWEQVLASIDKSDDRFSVSVNFPDKKFMADNNRMADVGFQQLAVSIDPIHELGYPEHTLKPPFLRRLNEFYSRQIAFDPWRIRVERYGIAEIMNVNDNSSTFYPIPHQVLIQKIFELAGIKSKISQAGLITKRIIEKIGGVDGGRVFKISSVRKLLQTSGTEDSFSRGEATRRIWDEGNFRKHEGLYIEPRKRPSLTPDLVFDFLLKKDFLRAGLELTCGHCRLSNWLSLAEIDDIWRCNYCGDENKTSLQLSNKGDWKFRKSGLFAKDNSQEGAIPVILALLVFLRIVNSSEFIYSPSLILEIAGKSCEVDFSVLQYGRGREIQLAIGECKSEAGTIGQGDVDNLKSVQEKIRKLGINCFMVFSKTAKEFTEEEITLFKKLRTERIPIILLTNKELEPYEPYWEIDEADRLPEKYALHMTAMCRNSEYIYLKDLK